LKPFELDKLIRFPKSCSVVKRQIAQSNNSRSCHIGRSIHVDASPRESVYFHDALASKIILFLTQWIVTGGWL